MASPARSKHRRRRPSGPVEAAELNGSRHKKPAAGRRQHAEAPAPNAAALVHELGSCVTEADIVQVLYRGLQPLFGYDVVNLHVLEREGWYHSLPIDSGVLQDLRRRPLSGSMFATQYANARTEVIRLDPKRASEAKGPGAGRWPKFAIWVPIEHQGEVIGSVIYQAYERRQVPPAETAFLDEVHRRLGVLLANASLNELTRNQARRLEALNSIARAMAPTLDETSVHARPGAWAARLNEPSVLAGLPTTLRELLPVDALEMVAMQDDGTDRVRLLH